MIAIKTTLRFLYKYFRKIIYITGWIFVVMIALSFTDYPYLAYHWLGTSKIEKIDDPNYIVLMGAGGMPGPQGLLRCYYAALVAEKYPQSKIIVALPADSASFEDSDHFAMINELLRWGIDSERILSEIKGINTFTQAANIKQIAENTEAKVLVITSPEHMYRSILTFKKAGFGTVTGVATFENSFDEELLIEDTIKGKKSSKPERNLDLRYNMWSYLQYEIIVMREFTAITYYKLMGYI
ncbi:MAG: YdcF family protein [Bacteroidales bacterium]|nr:YdcF family protein [Bacteroidales bacterium]